MSTWQEGIRQLAGQVTPRAGRFLRWWRDSLRAWLPVRWQWALGWLPARLLLHVEETTLHASREVAGVRTRVARLPWPCEQHVLDTALEAQLRRLPRVWLLPSSQVLRRPMRLPAAAGERLHDVVAFEIDRQTPFNADQVVHDVRVLGAAAGTQIDVELVVLPRTRLDAWQQQVGGWATRLAGIDVLDEGGVPLQVNLLPAAQRHHPPDPQRRRDALLLAAALVFAVLAGAGVLDNRRAAADTLRARMEADARRARGVADQRGQLQALVDGERFLQQRARYPSTLQVWNELTRLLPNGTYLEKLGVENGTVQLIGLSREASQLVPLLQPSPLWQRVNLTGVLQADQAAQGRDRFTLTAELKPLGNAPATTEAADAVHSQRP